MQAPSRAPARRVVAPLWLVVRLWLVARLCIAAAVMLALSACSDNRETGPASPQPQQTTQAPAPDAATAAAARLTTSLRQPLCESVSALEDQVGKLVQSGTTAALTDARQAWHTAHANWRLWQLLLTLAGPETATNAYPRIDAEPILPGYLDRVPGYPVSGLVYSEVPLGTEALVSAHQSTDLYYGVLGFHPLEFMLWGTSTATGEPTRVAGDFKDDPEAGPDAIPAAARRRTLTLNMAGLLQLEIGKFCAAQPQLPAALAVYFPPMTEGAPAPDESEKRRHLALIHWLDALTSTLETWRQYPEGEDNNGMPVWHSAFARTDFSESATLLKWLQESLWPQNGPPPETAGPLLHALQELASAPPGPEAETVATLNLAHDAALDLAQLLADSAGSVPEGESNQPAEADQ